MAVGTTFGEQNAVLRPPNGEEDRVYSLPIQRYVDNNNYPSIISAWKLSDEEIEEIKRTGIVYVSTAGYTLSPMFVAGIYPEANVVHDLYLVEDDEHMMRLAEEIDKDAEMWNDLTERLRMNIDAKKAAIDIYLRHKL